MIRPLTEKEKRSLIRRGVDPELFKENRIFGTSDALTARFNRQREAAKVVDERCGLDRLTFADFKRIEDAKRELRSMRPQDPAEEAAWRGRCKWLGIPARGRRGRPKIIGIENHARIREEARQLERAAGKSRQYAIGSLAEKYGASASYIRRILEDAGE